MSGDNVKSEIEQELVRKFGAWEKPKLVSYLASLVKTYVRDATLPFNLELPEADVLAEDQKATAEGLTFAKLMLQLKSRVGLPQLDEFEIEDGKVTLTINNQKITFGERTTIEFVARRQQQRRPSQRTEAPARPALDTPIAKKKPRAEPEPEAPSEEEAAHNVRERFRRLDMD